VFTLDQIQEAHSRVKSGADFPQYIQDLMALGVTNYQTYVSDGHTEFLGANDFSLITDAKYDTKEINTASNSEQFKADLRAHQQGRTDYSTFCNDCAKSGIERWHVSIAEMTCTYFDKTGNKILTERIPQ
jgi:uncharacterized protein YbcV (DUF1398 family)